MKDLLNILHQLIKDITSYFAGLTNGNKLNPIFLFDTISRFLNLPQSAFPAMYSSDCIKSVCLQPTQISWSVLFLEFKLIFSTYLLDIISHTFVPYVPLLHTFSCPVDIVCPKFISRFYLSSVLGFSLL